MEKFYLRTHFISLFIVIFGIIIGNLSSYQLKGNIEFIFRLLTLITGIILFFRFRKGPQKKLLYFSIYPVFFVLAIFGFFFRGMIAVFLFSLFLAVIPEQCIYEKDNIAICIKNEGLLSSCCTYKVKERFFYFLERDYGVFESGEEIDLKTIQVQSTDGEMNLSYAFVYRQIREHKTIRKKTTKQ